MKNSTTIAIKTIAKQATKKVVKGIGNNWPADNCFFWSYCPKRPKCISDNAPKEK